MLGWALRMVLVVGGLALAAHLVLPEMEVPAPAGAPPPAAAPNTMVFRADPRGHVVLPVHVNGEPMRMLVDTGASAVALSRDQAAAAGIGPGRLRFEHVVHTANGRVRAAPVTLEEVRVGQLALQEVAAFVIDAPLDMPLLGMSFLKRLEGYEMRGGELTLSW